MLGLSSRAPHAAVGVARIDKADESTVLYVRVTHRELPEATCRCCSGWQGPGYLLTVLQGHISELERKGGTPETQVIGPPRRLFQLSAHLPYSFARRNVSISSRRTSTFSRGPAW